MAIRGQLPQSLPKARRGGLKPAATRMGQNRIDKGCGYDPSLRQIGDGRCQTSSTGVQDQHAPRRSLIRNGLGHRNRVG